MRAALLVRVCVYVRACVCECVPHRNLFNSQQTWLLLLVQVGLTVVQWLITVGFSYRHHEDVGWASALFQSINTRHAGMASFSMASVDAATLLL